MPSNKKQRAQAKKAKKTKEVKEDDRNGVDSINMAALSLSEDEIKLRECDRLNKILFEVVDNFSSNFVVSKKYNGTVCRHGCSDPISHRCQRVVGGITEIFKEGVIKPEAVEVVNSKLQSMKANGIVGTFCFSTEEKKLFAVAAGDFGYQEERWNVSYLAALGTELILRGGHNKFPGAEIAFFALATYIMSSRKEKMRLTDGFAADMANSEGKMVQESLKFFSKRNGCSCLEEKFNMKRVKKEASMSQCSNCKEENSKKKLYLCSRCSTAQYCSKDCQTKHWPEHKQDCKVFRELIKERESSATKDIYIKETVAYNFDDHGKVAGVTSSFPSEETWTVPRGHDLERSDATMGGGYMVTKDGKKIPIDESHVVPLQRVMANPKFQGIRDKCQSNPKASKAKEEFLSDPSLTLLKYMNDPEISKFLSDLADVMKESGVLN